MEGAPVRIAEAPAGILLSSAVLALVSCGEALAPLPREGAPEALEFSIGAFATGSDIWELRADTLVFRHIAPDGEVDSARRVPTAEDWQAFWTAAREAGVRRWAGRYEAEGVVDGVGWSLRLSAGEVRVEAEGSSAYPDREGEERELDPTPAFRTFRSAAEDLAGSQP